MRLSSTCANPGPMIPVYPSKMCCKSTNPFYLIGLKGMTAVSQQKTNIERSCPGRRLTTARNFFPCCGGSNRLPLRLSCVSRCSVSPAATWRMPGGSSRSYATPARMSSHPAKLMTCPTNTIGISLSAS